MPADLDALTRHLDLERDLLRDGRLAELAGLEAAREHLLADVGALDEAALAVIRTRLASHGEMMQAACDGVRDALGRVRELTRAAGPIGSYSATGARQEIGTIRPTCIRKA